MKKPIIKKAMTSIIGFISKLDLDPFRLGVLLRRTAISLYHWTTIFANKNQTLISDEIKLLILKDSPPHYLHQKFN